MSSAFNVLQSVLRFTKLLHLTKPFGILACVSVAVIKTFLKKLCSCFCYDAHQKGKSIHVLKLKYEMKRTYVPRQVHTNSLTY